MVGFSIFVVPLGLAIVGTAFATVVGFEVTLVTVGFLSVGLRRPFDGAELGLVFVSVLVILVLVFALSLMSVLLASLTTTLEAFGLAMALALAIVVLLLIPIFVLTLDLVTILGAADGIVGLAEMVEGLLEAAGDLKGGFLEIEDNEADVEMEKEDEARV